jgi:hypothetical protein
MRVVCLHIPRPPPGNAMAMAIYTTKWDTVGAKFFLHQLENLASAMQQPFSLEFYVSESTVYVCIAAEDEMLRYLTTGIYSWFVDVEIRDIEDYTRLIDEHTAVVGTDLFLTKSDIYPIQNYTAYAYDSVAPMLTAMSRIHAGDRLVLQALVRPIAETPTLQVSLKIRRKLERFVRLFRAKTWFKRDLETKSRELIAKKCQSKLFKVNYRITALTQIPHDARASEKKTIMERLSLHVSHVVKAIKVYNTTDENRFGFRALQSGVATIRKMQDRSFDRPFLLSGVELSTLWHPPGLGTLPNTAQVLSRKAPPPRLLPSALNDPQVSLFGHTNYRDQSVTFGLRRFDRRRHLYVLGKSGNGKSCLLQLLVKSDIENGFGCAVLDPHGDLVDDVLRFVPKHRAKDVVIFDPGDVKFPPSFNPLDPSRPELKMRVTLSFVDTFRRIFGSGWSEKMDHLLRYAMIGLLNIPGSSVVSLRRMLSDDEFRAEVVRRCPDEAARRFWEMEFNARREEFEQGPASQLLNRLDELLATDMIRNILGQSTNAFNFRDLMDNRKIVLLKVSKGILGADNASLLGSLLIWKIYEAAMSRADIPVEQRQDFYFYVDEFQNFATESFGEILAESRKYRLCLTFANQFLGQLPPNIQQTVFGNVANLLCFRVGSADAGVVAQEFKPRFGSEDLLNLALREFYLKISVDGEVQEAFSARTMNLDYPTGAAADAIMKESIAHSRKHYSLSLDQAREQLALSEITSLRSLRG